MNSWRTFRRSATLACLLAASLLVVGPIGCSPSVPPRPANLPSEPAQSQQTSPESVGSDSAEAALPQTYVEGVRRVRELRQTLHEGWKADNHDQVHEPLHQLAPLLRHLPKLLDKEQLPEAERTERARAIHELYELFYRVDAKLHSGFGASYDDAAPTIDELMERL